MKRAYLTEYGNPADVVKVKDDPAVGQPAEGRVTVDILGASINPAELLLIQGKYASQPPVPLALGIEGAGRVAAVGDGVTGLKAGDLVMCIPRQNWAEQVDFAQHELVPMPADIDPLQAAMLKVNPATALMMLRDMRKLEKGDWVVQNAANSAVGQYLIRIAKEMGLKTANLVRRDSLVSELTDIGADLVLVDSDKAAQEIRGAAEGRVRLAIDAVGGAATMKLADSLDDEGLIVNYGLLSGEPCQLGAEHAIFRSISLRGFWLAKELGAMEPAHVGALYQELAAQVVKGTLSVPVEATYGLDDISAALTHAMKEGRNGKILITPNG